jgi:hypothetical protein
LRHWLGRFRRGEGNALSVVAFCFVKALIQIKVRLAGAGFHGSRLLKTYGGAVICENSCGNCREVMDENFPLGRCDSAVQRIGPSAKLSVVRNVKYGRSSDKLRIRQFRTMHGFRARHRRFLHAE